MKQWEYESRLSVQKCILSFFPRLRKWASENGSDIATYEIYLGYPFGKVIVFRNERKEEERRNLGEVGREDYQCLRREDDHKLCASFVVFGWEREEEEIELFCVCGDAAGYKEWRGERFEDKRRRKNKKCKRIGAAKRWFLELLEGMLTGERFSKIIIHLINLSQFRVTRKLEERKDGLFISAIYSTMKKYIFFFDNQTIWIKLAHF